MMLCSLCYMLSGWARPNLLIKPKKRIFAGVNLSNIENGEECI